MRSRRAPRPLAGAVERLATELSPADLLSEVQRVWDHAVGSAIAAEARPVGERAGTVTVACSSAVWAQELELLGPELAARINTRLGRPAVNGLRCRLARSH